MNPELKDVYKHIQGLALGALAHANRHACYHSRENRWWPELSVLQAGHAAELMIKARIAQEHPLLIFEQIPRSTQAVSTRLEFEDLFERGKTLQYFDLPERLWATTGVRLANLELYHSFGRLRNALQHFGSDRSLDLSGKTLEFVFGIIDPLMHECWRLFAIDYDEDHVDYEYMFPAIAGREIFFNVSPGAAAHWKSMEEELKGASEGYRDEMSRRVSEVRIPKPKFGSYIAKYNDREWWQSPWPWYGGTRKHYMEDFQLISCDSSSIPAQIEVKTNFASGNSAIKPTTKGAVNVAAKKAAAKKAVKAATKEAVKAATKEAVKADAKKARKG